MCGCFKFHAMAPSGGGSSVSPQPLTRLYLVSVVHPFYNVLSSIAGTHAQIHGASGFPRQRARGGAAPGRHDPLHVSGLLYDHPDAGPGRDVLQTHL